MASKSSLFLFAILAALAVAVPIIAANTAAAPRSPKPGGYQPIEDLDAPDIFPEIFAVAKFAVEEHNKEKKSSLKLDQVAKGEWQVVAGIIYRLVITAHSPGDVITDFYTVVVHKNLKGALSLVSFQI